MRKGFVLQICVMALCGACGAIWVGSILFGFLSAGGVLMVQRLQINVQARRLYPFAAAAVLTGGEYLFWFVISGGKAASTVVHPLWWLMVSALVLCSRRLHEIA